jgi:MarR family transcriptional regulator, negative regulator of the multidrug operon emrRAB
VKGYQRYELSDKINLMRDLNTFRLIERISTLLRSEQRKKYTAIGLQPIHVQILEFLFHCNRHSDTPAAVGDYLGLTKGTMSQSLQVLERKGYISKTIDTDDRRVVHLSLQDSGRQLLAAVQPLDMFDHAEQQVAKRHFSTLDEALHATLKALQIANQSRSFGVCHSCKHFSEIDNHYHCQLTDLPLTQSDALKICREHRELSDN